MTTARSKNNQIRVTTDVRQGCVFKIQLYSLKLIFEETTVKKPKNSNSYDEEEDEVMNSVTTNFLLNLIISIIIAIEDKSAILTTIYESACFKRGDIFKPNYIYIPIVFFRLKRLVSFFGRVLDGSRARN